MNHWQTLQQNYRTCYKQIRWPHTSNRLDIIFHSISAAYFWLQNFNKKLFKERNLLEIFVKELCFWKKSFDNKKWKESSSAMDRPMFQNMSKTFSHFVRLGTWNLIDVFSKVFTESCLLFDKLTCVRIEKNSLVLHQVRVIFESLSQIYPCCNNCQVNLFLFQRYDIMFILSSSPKVGICSKRSNLHGVVIRTSPNADALAARQKLLCFVVMQKISSVLHQVRVIFKNLSQIYPCCNKCQVNLFLFQRFDIMFILSSSPKIGICSNRSKLLITLLFRGIISEKSLVLWNCIFKALVRARFNQS